MSAFSAAITEALARLERSGATPAELASARNVLCHLAENNRSACTVDLGRGVRASLPANPGAKGLQMYTRK